MKKRNPRKKKIDPNVRNRSKYPALDPSLNLKSRTEEIQDIDYIDKLNEKEKIWLNGFLEEWIGANLQHKGKKFHKTRKDRKLVYDKNNARNRDAFVTTKIMGKLEYGKIAASENPEDALILMCDINRKKYRKRRT